MIRKKHIALLGLVVLGGALAIECTAKQEPAPAPRRLAAARPAYRGPLTYVQIDTTDPAVVRAFPAIVRIASRRLGYPRASTVADGGAAAFVTTAPTRPIPHPTQAGRWRLPVDEQETLPGLRAIKAACAIESDVGDGGFCARLAGLSFVATRTLDDSWSLPVDAGAPRDLDPQDDFPSAQ